MKLPFINCKGAMCDPEIQRLVLEDMLREEPHNLVDWWGGLTTHEASYDCNIFDDEYGADDGCYTVLLYPVYEFDGELRTDHNNVVGRASIKVSDVNPYWVGGVRPLPKRYNVFSGVTQINDEPLLWEDVVKQYSLYANRNIDLKVKVVGCE